MAEKKYRNAYTEHCIRHPKDAVSYANFRWRVRHRWEKLAIRLWKLESAEKMDAKIQEKKQTRRKIKQAITLHQKEIEEKKERRRKIEIIAMWIILFALGVVVWIVL